MLVIKMVCGALVLLNGCTTSRIQHFPDSEQFHCEFNIFDLTNFITRYYPVIIYRRATISPPAKHHSNGASLAGRWWPYTVCWLDNCSGYMIQLPSKKNIGPSALIFAIYFLGIILSLFS